MKKYLILFALCFLLSGCGFGDIDSPETAYHFIKVWMPNNLMAFLFCFTAAIVLFAATTLFMKGAVFLYSHLRAIKNWFLNGWNYFWIGVICLFLIIIRHKWPDWVWDWYQASHPVWLTAENNIFVNDTVYAISGFGEITEQTIVDMYLDRLKDSTRSDYEYNSVVRLLNELRDTFKLKTVLSLYEPINIECGLNPFRIRDDGRAAGLIQFTNAGLEKIYYKGEKVSLADVKECCRVRDIDMMCAITKMYLLNVYKSKKAFNKYIDVYIAIFAPAHVGKDDNFVLYQGKDNDDYYLNAGFDGWYVNNTGQILWSKEMKDYKITIKEVKLTVIAKRERLMKKYLTSLNH